MDGEKRPSSDHLDKFHNLLELLIHRNLPGSGEAVIAFSLNEAIGLLTEYVYRKGQIKGLQEGGELLKSIIENR
jgi:hypothetical protein